MDKAVLDAVVAQTNALLAVDYALADVKAAANAWLASDKGEEATKAYTDALGQGIMTIDELLAYCESDACAKDFGEEEAKGMLAHAKELKAVGKKYCDCEACSACEAILKALGAIA